jgi:hypothetical protein
MKIDYGKKKIMNGKDGIHSQDFIIDKGGFL